MSGPGSYQNYCFCPGSQCGPFQNEVSVSPDLGSCSQALLAFSATRPGLTFPVPDPRAGEPDMELSTLTPAGAALGRDCSPVCGSPTQGRGVLSYHGLPLLPVSLWPLMYLGVEELFW